MPAEACTTLLSALKEAEQSGHAHGTQITLSGKNGPRCFELSIARRHTLAGQSPRFVVLSRDISDRKEAEQELHIAATAFNSQEGMIITDTSHRILRVNNAFTQVTGYSAAEVIDKNPSILSSGRHDSDFYSKMMEELENNKYWQGEIWNKRKNGEIYPEWLTITAVTDDHAKVTNYVAAFTDITQRKQAEADIHTLAFYDSLTGLPNRRLLLDRLEQSLLLRKRRHQLGALMFIDLDNFKTLNDTQGHDVGDCLLIEVAQRLRHSVREVDTVARLGGDEFIIILEDLNADYNQAALDAEQIAEKIVQALNQPYPLKDSEYHGTASIGLSLFDHRDKNAKDLLKRADVAMYQAKESGRNTLRFFDPKIQQELYIQAEMESELRRAIADEQLVLYYQAQTYLGKVTGAEVLLRWIHPEKGLIPPGKFIPLAEQCGLIIPLGNWVLETACRQLAVWADHPELSKVTLSVNVSAHQFGMVDFVSNVEHVLGETGAKGELLKFELTESAVLIDVDSTADKMMQLKDLGINFSIDDFGTGYSSLFHLKHLPVDQLKIDRSFVRDINEDPDNLAIVQAIIAMAHNLGISVIA
ncbi:putative bifunctional diguanylate cyclase/phosphodiesterase, partial [Pontibacterium sp.]|uniref:putative bifunctional diguanylate cyclase/phosphodiesterase n=1 Tax=Pontibacterium sp. TaxID=2036026 RepID=UPI0035672B4E